MRNKLSVFDRFAHDPQGILAAVGRFAFVGIERRFNVSFGVSLKLGVATFAHADSWRDLFYYAQLALWHDYLNLMNLPGSAERP